jgi:hypothetical protein
MRSLFRDIFPDERLADDGHPIPRLLILVFILGFVIRLFACQYTYIVNPDGALYIHQAKAIYYGQWEELSSCVVSFVSSYPLLIVGGYAIFHDWIISAKFISLVFGSLTLVPVYLLLRRFLDRRISVLGTLVFSVTPLFVARSADVIRDPIYWFFAALGLYFFVSSDQEKYRLPILFSSLCFIMAAWARIEAILYIIISCVFILAVRQDKRIQKIVIFTLPAILLMLLLFTSLSLFDISNQNLFRWKDIGDKLSEPFVQYKNLRAGLKDLVPQTSDGGLPHFLPKARNMIWLVALGTLIKNAVDVYFYPFFAIFLVGLAGARRKLKEDPRIFYLVFSSICALVLLYVHLVQTWMMLNRFLALLFLPSFIFSGYGIERITRFCQTRFHFKASVAHFLLAVLVLSCALPKDLKPRESDKLVFKEIGQYLAALEGNEHEIDVAASSVSIRWVSFYANYAQKRAICPQKHYNLRKLAGNSYGEFVDNLRKGGVRFFLWEETLWPKEIFDFQAEQTPEDFIEIGRWWHPDTGRLVLFKVT